MRHRAAVAAFATSIIILAGNTIVLADDEIPAPTTTEAPATTTTTDAPAITITVETEPVDEAAPTTESESPASDPEPEPTVATDPPVTAAAPGTTVAVADAVTTTTNQQNTHGETAVVTGTVVAVGDSGSNQAHNDGPATGSTVVPSGEIDTGNATAVGSDDENIVGQQADVVLTDQAVANILQVALILNIGAAFANAGFNAIDSTPAGVGAPGAIGTGNASAVGNDIDQYLTQAARVTADDAIDDSANQLAVSLWLGLALANSGANSVTGTGVTGSGGAIGAGNATAIGNDSLTDVDQRASIIGSGTSQTDITQRATVLNLGFALANSGLNGIEGVANQLLTADDAADDQIAEDLFVMLLPALLQSYGYVGAGQINTGNATAVGNQSQTFVQQIAAAVASGDGVASIVQDVLVANVGAAGANTGVNTLGSRATLDEPTARAVVMMSAFLAQLLSMVHQSSNAIVEQGIEVPFGDLVLQLSGSFGALDTQLSQGGARVNMRQVSIVLSLGVARANSGHNQAITTNAAGVPVLTETARSVGAQANTEAAALGAAETMAAVDALPSTIHSGDVDSKSTTLVVICQRINAQDIACLAPPEPETPVEPPVTTTTIPAAATTTTVPGVSPEAPVTTVPGVVTPDVTTTVPDGPAGFRVSFPTDDSSTRSTPLPSTGNSDLAWWLAFAFAAIGGGLIMTGAVRRRRPVIVRGR